MIAEDLLDGGGFQGVVERCGSAVGADVVDSLGLQFRVFHGEFHGAGRSLGRRVRCREMISIGIHAEPEKLGQDGRSAFLCVAQAFQHQHSGALGQDKPVAADTEGAAGPGGIVVAGGKRTQLDVTVEGKGGDHGLRPAGHHDIRPPQADQVQGVADAVVAGRAGGGNTQVGAAQPIAHRHVGCGHIGDDDGHGQGVKFPSATVEKFGMFLFQEGKPTDARTNGDPHPRQIHRPFPIGGEPGLIQRLPRGTEGELRKTGQTFRRPGVEIEIPHLPGDLGFIGCGVERRDPADPRNAFDQGMPERSDVVTDARNHAQTGDHNALHERAPKTKEGSPCNPRN